MHTKSSREMSPRQALGDRETRSSGLAGELGTDDNVSSPSMVNIEEREDEEHVFLKVAEAGQKVLKLYRQLHRVHLVNYTFLATHHLFMAGMFPGFSCEHKANVLRYLISVRCVAFTHRAKSLGKSNS